MGMETPTIITLNEGNEYFNPTAAQPGKVIELGRFAFKTIFLALGAGVYSMEVGFDGTTFFAATAAANMTGNRTLVNADGNVPVLAGVTRLLVLPRTAPLIRFVTNTRLSTVAGIFYGQDS